jgi:hypothetical protein
MVYGARRHGSVNLTCALYKDGVCRREHHTGNLPTEAGYAVPGRNHPDDSPPDAAAGCCPRTAQASAEFVKQQRDWDEEMQRRRQIWDLELQRRQHRFAQQQQQQSGQQTICCQTRPHYGQEWQNGMRALGEVIRPYSKWTPSPRRGISVLSKDTGHFWT